MGNDHYSNDKKEIIVDGVRIVSYVQKDGYGTPILEQYVYNKEGVCVSYYDYLEEQYYISKIVIDGVSVLTSDNTDTQNESVFLIKYDKDSLISKSLISMLGRLGKNKFRNSVIEDLQVSVITATKLCEYVESYYGIKNGDQKTESPQ